MGALTGGLGFGGGASGTGFGGPSDQPRDYTGNANLSTTFGQLQGVANGTGPNPAMAQYNQNVQDLAKQQSGAISSVQGISPALAARMISQQGSAAMQNAAAQGATMQSQQQLGALGQMGNVAGQQAGLSAGMQQNVNNTNAGLAGGIMGQQSTAIGGMFNSAGQMMGMMGGGGAKGGMVRKMASGGQVMPMAGGGEVGPISQFSQFLSGTVSTPSPVSVQSFNMPSTVAATPGVSAPSSATQGTGGGPSMGTEVSGPGPTAGSPDMYTKGNYGENVMGANTGPSVTSPTYANDLMNRDSGMGGASEAGYAGGGKVKAMLSPGERYIPPQQVGKASQSTNPLQYGRQIPGKPKVAGNSYANDVVPQKLEQGGVVIPNSIMQSKNPPAAAKRFIEAVQKAKKGKK